MPDVIEPPEKQPFSKMFTASRPGTEAELRAMAAAEKPGAVATPEPPKPPPTGKTAPASAPPTDDLGAEVAEIAAGKKSPTNKHFGWLKGGLDKANKAVEELKVAKDTSDKELAELKKRPVHNADLIAKLEKERNEFKAKFEQVAVEIDPVKIAEHQGRLKSVQESVKSLAGDKADEILSIFAMPESDRKRKALAEAVEDMDPITVDDINAARREYNAVHASRQAEIAKANETLGAMAEARTKQQQERKTAYEKSFESVLAAKSAGDDALPVLQTREGDTPEVKAWNDSVQEIKTVAKAIFNDQFETPDEKAEASIWAASAKGFLEGWKADSRAKDAEIATLKETLAKVQGSTPGLVTGGKAADGGKKLSFSERVMDNAL